MSSANRKEHRVSFQPIPGSKGHRQRTSDSGVGSDFDGYGSSPSAEDYFALEKAHKKLKEELAAVKSDLKEADARFRALQNTIEVLENDKTALIREKRTLRDEIDVLREDNRKSRSSPPQREHSARMSGALPAHPPSPKEPKPSRRSESKRRGESKVRKSSEEKELAKRVKEDKERLGRRFEIKDDKSVSSSSSSGRSKHDSYVDPYNPSSVVEPTARPRTNRSESSYSSIRPSVITTTTVTDPRYADIPRTSTYAGHDGYDDDEVYLAEDGNYYPYPLPTESRGRTHR
ncbi:hypothetical protein EsH8_II_000176 [Colletotrichum jinshuiense]